MNFSKSFKSLFLGLIIILFLTTAKIISSNNLKPDLIISKQNSALNLNSIFFKYISAGNKRLISSALWLSTILESDIEHYKKRDLNSWMYLRFKTILALDENFYQVYLLGGQYLSIIKDDLNGASEIYKLGLQKYPNDIKLIKDAIFHFHFEVKDYSVSIPLLKHAKKMNNIGLVYTTLLAKIEKEEGNFDSAYLLLKDSLLKTPEKSTLREKIKEHLYSIKAERDLNCLNQKLNSCEYFDEDGNPYLLNNGIYSANKKWNKLIWKK